MVHLTQQNEREEDRKAEAVRQEEKRAAELDAAIARTTHRQQQLQILQAQADALAVIELERERELECQQEEQHSTQPPAVETPPNDMARELLASTVAISTSDDEDVENDPESEAFAARLRGGGGGIIRKRIRSVQKLLLLIIFSIFLDMILYLLSVLQFRYAAIL